MMVDRQHLLELAVVAGTGSVGAASVVVAAKIASDPGDILGFFGGAVGAGLAVAGALWLESRKRVDQASTDRRLIGESLLMLLAATKNNSDHGGRNAVVRFRSVVQNMQNYLRIKDRMLIDNAMHSAAFTTLGYWCERNIAKLEDICDAFESGDSAHVDEGKAICEKIQKSALAVLKSPQLFDERFTNLVAIVDEQTPLEGRKDD